MLRPNVSKKLLLKEVAMARILVVDDRPEVAPSKRQHILVPRRAFTVKAPLEQSCLDQAIEASGEHIGCDAEAFLELVEARQPAKRVAQNQDAPPLADAFKAAGDRTGLSVESCSLHYTTYVLGD